jgi:hypothetical protein
MNDPRVNQPILLVTEGHLDPFPYQAFLSPTPGCYVGFFTNQHGDQWLFLYDPELGGGILTGGDVAWELYPLGDGPIPIHALVLNEPEKLWLQACWDACAWLRDRQEGAVPENILNLGKASAYWQVPETTLKRHAAAGELVARKLGNVWVTTIEAMLSKYGPPTDLNNASPTAIKVLMQDSDQNRQLDTETIKHKLATNYWRDQSKTG